MTRIVFKNRILFTSLSIIFLGTLVKIILTFKSGMGLTIPEVETTYLVKSLPHALSPDGRGILNFAKEHGYLLFPLQLLFLSFFVYTLPLTAILLRIPQFIISLASMIILLYIIFKRYEKAPNHKLLILFASFIIILSPWYLSLTFINLGESISLLASLLIILLLTKAVRERFFPSKFFIKIALLTVICALSSWSGLFFSLAFPFFFLIFLKKNFNKPPTKFTIFTVLVTYTAIFSMLVINRQYIKTTLSQNTFISKLKLTSLAEEINERQKIDFLAANRQFILPGSIRKFTYNKAQLAVQKTIKQIVSFFDFEQLSFPLASYDIIRLSGLLPKGNLPLLYLWDIPVIAIGVFWLLKKRGRKDSWIPYFLISATLPAIIFEKRFFATSGCLLLPLFLITEIEGVNYILPSYLNLKPLIKKMTIFISLIITTIGVINFHNLFFLNEFKYRTSHYFFFKQISTWLSENRTKYKKVVVTTRFGPSHLMSAFYLDLPSGEFWPKYLFPEKKGVEEIVKIQNLEFRSINFPDEEKSPEIAYLGLPGEFVQPGKDLDLRKLPTGAALLEKIIAPDELVFNYGENLWVINFR